MPKLHEDYRELNSMIVENVSNKTDKITALYFALTTKVNPCFIPYGKMTWADNKYYFAYTKAFNLHRNAIPELKNMVLNPDCGLNQTWEMNNLHHTLISRIPRRQKSMELYELLGLKDRKGDVIAFLSRTCGQKFGSSITVFPEVLPDESGHYYYYFPISGLATKIKEGDEKVKAIADSISNDDNLQIIRDNESNKIYFNNICLGKCPQYTHYLTGLEQFSGQDPRLQIVKINHQENAYGVNIIVSLKLKFTSNPYLLSDLTPINLMPC